MNVNIGTIIHTMLFGELVGEDSIGNRYYQSEYKRWFGKEKRWVVYANSSAIANLSCKWFNWLHYRSNLNPSTCKSVNHSWEVDVGMTKKTNTMQKNTPFSKYDGIYTSWENNQKYSVK